jgi:hypothetical protein
MKIWLLEQFENMDYDTFDSCVVYAETEEDARNTLPDSDVEFEKKHGSWASCPETVKVTYLGMATPNAKAGVICASFNAG